MVNSDDKRLVLLILDGWGYREETEHNAVKLSNPINFNKLMSENPHMLLDASEEMVGLPKGQMGNSEVGHMNIGAGRIIYQDLVLITKSFEDNDTKKLANINSYLSTVAKSGKTLHLMGLVSDGGVHSHIEHFKSVAKYAKTAGIKNIIVHAITDGRDTSPNSGIGYVMELDKWLKDNKSGVVGDLVGRYYAMDRDKRWDRVEIAYNLFTKGVGEQFDSIKDAFDSGYKNNITDEFMKPTTIKGVNAVIKDGDALFLMNFRADRVREILSVFHDKEFSGFNRGKQVNCHIMTMSEYDQSVNVEIAFKSNSIDDVLGDVISKKGYNQLRIAETEKYAHVTYFFNGGREEPFTNEDRTLVPSPRDVATYDLKPEMSVREVYDKFEIGWTKNKYKMVIMNFANPDMVGHTGVEVAAIKACKTVDEMLGKVMAFCKANDIVLLVTADHGNSELMWDYKKNQPYTAHTINPVPFIVYNYDCKLPNKRGKLADIAPTILKILGIKKPEAMTGESLIV